MPAQRTTAQRIRSTRAWQRLAKQVCTEEPICWLRLAGCTIRSTTGDHIIPASARPDLALVRSNVRGACAPCNNKRGHLPPELAREMYGTATSTEPHGQGDKPRALAIFDT
jgi:5-methylcytosine-specific restriction endonuclease McrA